MNYPAVFTLKDSEYTVRFPDCPGCQASGSDEGQAKEAARKALEIWLEVRVETGKLPPLPTNIGHAFNIWMIPVNSDLVGRMASL